MISFVVHGHPATQGSKRAFVVHSKTGPRAVVTEDNKGNRAWRQDVAAMAREAYDGPLLDGPLMLRLVFVFARPKKHYGTGRNAGKLKDASPIWKDSTPDCSKLARAIEDALTKVVWRDDAQIAGLCVSKVWGGFDHVTVSIKRLP